MNVLLATLAINEMEFLPKLWEQHKDFSGLTKHVFVEAADASYQAANPDMVSKEGLSVDGTTEWLEQLAKSDDRVVHVKYGLTSALDPAQAKCAARNVYLEVADAVKPDVVVTLDADEMYTKNHQWFLMEVFRSETYRAFRGLIFHRREIWRPPSIAHLPLLGHEVVGGFWAIPCCHWWRWSKGMRYDGNHNNPKAANGAAMEMLRMDRQSVRNLPQMVHLGFAATPKTRQAKNDYYQQRGEGKTDRRGWYVESRSSWLNWQPGNVLPRGAQVVPYQGPKPECFADG